MFNEFRKFAMKGNVMDMAVGIILGGAFGTIVKSLVDEVIMPPVGMVLGGVDFSNLFVVLKEGATPGPYASLADVKQAGGVAVGYGQFLNTVIAFIIVAFAVFLLVKSLNAMKSKEAPADAVPTTKECSYCASPIPIKAKRCPLCTSQLAA